MARSWSAGGVSGFWSATINAHHKVGSLVASSTLECKAESAPGRASVVLLLEWNRGQSLESAIGWIDGNAYRFKGGDAE